jgi:hypothetical protein
MPLVDIWYRHRRGYPDLTPRVSALTNQATIADRYGVRLITEVAGEFITE